MTSALPKFKAIKIKLNDNNNLDINSKGVLTISSCKKEKKDIDINKLNSAISKIKSNFTEGKKRGRKPKIVTETINELIEPTETDQEITEVMSNPEPIKEYKKRGRKPKIRLEPEIPVIARKRGRPRKEIILSS